MSFLICQHSREGEQVMCEYLWEPYALSSLGVMTLASVSVMDTRNAKL